MMNGPGESGGIAFTITGKDIWDSLQGVRESVDRLHTDLAGVPAQLADHELRIRALEKRVWLAAGFAAGAGGTVGGLLSRLLAG